MSYQGWKVPTIAIISFGLGAAGGVFAKTSKPTDYTLTLPADLKFAPADPSMPQGPQAAILSGDPKTGPVAFVLKVPKGPAPIHWHTSDYYGMTLKGQTKHWLAGKDADAKTNPENTFWFQPGGSDKTAHGDECLSDTCMYFIFMPGKLDLHAVTPPAKK